MHLTGVVQPQEPLDPTRMLLGCHTTIAAAGQLSNHAGGYFDEVSNKCSSIQRSEKVRKF